MTIEPSNHHHNHDYPDSNFIGVEQPLPLLKKEHSFQRERQISIDPVSLMGPTIRQASFHLVSPPKPGSFDLQLPLPPPKLKFLSASLPSSATSSPNSTSNSSFLKKAWKTQNDNNHFPRPFTHLSSMETGSYLSRKSKSMSEGRHSIAQLDDFDLLFSNLSPSHQAKPISISKQSSNVEKGRDSIDREHTFRCGKLCIFLPRSSTKAKPVHKTKPIFEPKPIIKSNPNSNPIITEPKPVPNSARESRRSDTKEEEMSMSVAAISKRFSLEKFEWGSSSSSSSSEGVLVNREDEEMMGSMFFDLPVELLRCSVSDMQSPVTAAFVFEDEGNERLFLGNERLLLGKEKAAKVKGMEAAATAVSGTSSSAASRVREESQEFDVMEIA